ncbi:MAG: tRNA uridine-5-carboxymethylaminomethyl(34) synthesis GTPase MnmE [Acidobacteriota bacterium]|nr:tRNA uridine-5-carboxymethylaminomethyl(34) synthesis GTPase MnmE [Acidobacteriota bacterium]
MFSTADTIVAIATPAGRGGLGVVRISGAAAQAIAQSLLGRSAPLQPRRASFGRVRAAVPPGIASASAASPDSPSTGTCAIDQVVATFFPAPRSYTGEDTVEIAAHGSPVVLDAIVDAAMTAGGRLAEPGEFTLRAFLNGRIDLVQAEAVADLIDAVTPLQARAACDQLDGTLTGAIVEIERGLFELIARLEASIDFPEEGYHFIEAAQVRMETTAIAARIGALLAGGRGGRLLREGARVAIVGKPNVGKSSLFNFLVGTGRAIVAAEPGTTRDLVSETVDLGGLKVTLVDTAGVRETSDAVEAEGVGRAREAAAAADLQLVVLDRSRTLDVDDARVMEGATVGRTLLVVNKTDAADAWTGQGSDRLCAGAPRLDVSLKSGAGCGQLASAVIEALGVELTPRDSAAITNRRQIGLLENAAVALQRAVDGLDGAGGPVPEEFVLQDLHAAREALEEVRGRRAPDEVLQEIFRRFCIGK